MSNRISAGEWNNMRNFEVKERTLPCGKVVTAEYVRPKKGLIKMHLKICKVCKDTENDKSSENVVNVLNDRIFLSNKSIKRTGGAPVHSAVFHCFAE